MKREMLRRLAGVFRGIAFLLILLPCLMPATTVYAHAPDMYGQTQNIEITAEGLQADWKIAPGPLLADAIWGMADQNLDGSISPDEAQIWIAPFLAKLSFSIDGKPLDLNQTQSVHWPASVDLLRTGEDSIEVSLSAQWPEDLTGKHSLEIHNSHLESNSLNWFLLSAKEGLSFDSPAQDNGQLQLQVNFPDTAAASTTAVEASSLTSWNSGMPNLPAGFTDSISQLAVNLAGPTTPGQTQQPAPGGISAVTDALEGLVKTQTFSPLFLLSAFLLSLALGSLHALTPGHGKTLVAAYLVGTRGKVRDAVFLGAVVTTTHTGSVVILGLITLLASHYILPSLITPWLEVISGLLIIGFGINLLIRRQRDLTLWRRREHGPRPAVIYKTLGGQTISSKTASSTHTYGPGLAHHHDHPHDEHGGHAYPHHEELDHGHSHTPPEERVTWKSLLTLGISGGLIPCPDAIAILLVAVAVNRISFGMFLIVAFSLGLALVLIGIGIAMVQGVRLVARTNLLTRFGQFAPVISALVVLGLGIGLTGTAVNSFRFTSTVLRSPSAQNSNPLALSSASSFDIKHARLLYIATDARKLEQIFMVPIAGGKPTQYTSEDSGVFGYSISPDHETILYTVFNSNGATSLWAMNADGTGKRLALDCPQAECDSVEWYPDSQKIVYEHLIISQDSSIPRFSLWWLDLQTGKTQPVFQDPALASAAPRFSPDGQWLSYISPANNTILIYDLADGKGITIPLGFQPVIPETWSPTNDSILFGNQVPIQDATPLHITRYMLDSGKMMDLDGANDQTDYSAAWSPDGQWIAIDRDTAASGANGTISNEVCLVKPDGTQLHTLLNADNVDYSDLKWSPDSQYLVYSRYSFASASENVGQFDIYMADIQTGHETLLAPGGDLPTILP